MDESESLCEAHIGAAYVQVLEEANEDGDYYSYVRVLNNVRDIVDTIYGGSLGKNAIPVNTAHPTYWQLLRDLYSSAKRSALGADKIVDDIIGNLGVKDLSVSDSPF